MIADIKKMADTLAIHAFAHIPIGNDWSSLEYWLYARRKP